MLLEEELIEFSRPKGAENDEWIVEDMGGADWCCRKIAAAEKRKAEAEKFYKAELERLEAFYKKTVEREEKEINFFTGKLRPFAAAALEGQKRKTISLPNGSLSFRTKGATFQKNDKVLLEYVKANAPEFVKVKESVNWEEYKKTLTATDTGAAITADGEVVPGIIAETETEVFSVKLPKEAANNGD